MAGFTSRDDLINELTTNGKIDVFNFHKTAPANAEAAGVWQTLWKGTGQPGAGADAGATPGVAYDSDPTTIVAGSMFFPDRSTDQKHLVAFGAVATQSCTLMLYDRLASVSGLATGSTGSKTINSTALTRYTGTEAVNNEAWLEVTTASTAAGSMTLDSYTSGDGSTAVSGTAIALPATATDIHTMVKLPLNASEQGIRAAATLNVGTAATTSVCSFVILRPLARIPLIANQWNEVSFLDDLPYLPRIYDNACLGLALMASVTTAATVFGQITCAYG